jgi:hypothetical protein
MTFIDRGNDRGNNRETFIDRIREMTFIDRGNNRDDISNRGLQ